MAKVKIGLGVPLAGKAWITWIECGSRSSTITMPPASPRVRATWATPWSLLLPDNSTRWAIPRHPAFHFCLPTMSDRANDNSVAGDLDDLNLRAAIDIVSFGRDVDYLAVKDSFSGRA